MKIINDPSVRVFKQPDKIWWSNFWSTFDETFLDHEEPNDEFPLSSICRRQQENLISESYEVPEDLLSLEREIDAPDVEVKYYHCFFYFYVQFYSITS